MQVQISLALGAGNFVFCLLTLPYQTSFFTNFRKYFMNESVLVLNCGSSSIKFAIIDVKSGNTRLSGLAERLNDAQAALKFEYNNTKKEIELSQHCDHKGALKVIDEYLSSFEWVKDSLVAVGHRVVHGGEAFKQSVIITDDVKAAIADVAHMAPLHNPANLLGIESAQQAFPDLPHVAAFDTAFFQTLPEHAYLYALPYELYENHAVRRYGFHGSSHQFVSQEAAKLVNKPLSECNFISAHLGNGCSITAIKDGVAVDTSLGFTPLEGLVMGTRCGDLDPSLPSWLAKELSLNLDQISDLLNKQSGLLGISGVSNDCRTLEKLFNEGDKRAELALTIFCYRLAKYIASYMVATGPLDALVFTGGIGENSAFIREKTISLLANLQFSIDPQANLDKRFGTNGAIHSESSQAIYVIATNEEWVIASEAIRQTSKL